MSPRVLVVTHYWFPHVGGIESVAFEQCRRLAARGWSCTVVTSRLSGDQPLEIYDGIVVHRYRCLNTAERLLGVPVPIMSPRTKWDLAHLAADADVIVAHGHAYLGSLYAALAARQTRKPLVVVQHNPWVDYPHPLDWVEHAVDQTLGRWVLNQATIVVAVSECTRRFVSTIAPAAHSIVIHSGVDTSRFTPAPRRDDYGARFVTVRRLVPRNGVDTLIRAWQQSRLSPYGELLVAGNGPQRRRLQKLSGTQAGIRFLGRVNDETLPALYRHATAVVLPTRSGEGFGLVVAEALASGTPVIATRSGGVTELVKHGVNGLLVEPDQPRQLAAALRRVALDRSLAAQLRAGAQTCHERLSWDTSIAAFEELLARSAA